jgi:small subunit ribosomal protein S9
MADKQYFYGLGRRKCAAARVRVFPGGTGKVTINGKVVEVGDALYIDPLKLVGQFGSVDLSVMVSGGGTKGQIEAIRLGVARALAELNPDSRTTLRKAGYLTRDPRTRERKKPGLLSARRRPQWSKR